VEEDPYMGSYRDTTFAPTQKEVLAVCGTRREALRVEMFFHEMYDVVKSPMFANRAKLTSEGFCTEGITLGEDTRRKMREAKTGEKNPMFGKSPSPEARQRSREANLGKVVSEKTRQLIREAKSGCSFSEEHRKNLSKAKSRENHPNYGKTCKEETRRKISESMSGDKNPMYGKSHKEETRTKMSESRSGENNHAHGKRWWVDASGNRLYQMESPGPEWRNGMKWKEG
jgi:hypothetical protein